jgi:hypothetical protein
MNPTTAATLAAAWWRFLGVEKPGRSSFFPKRSSETANKPPLPSGLSRKNFQILRPLARNSVVTLVSGF